MEKKEKVEFILEQMRLCIAVKDYIRTQIISKKINTKFFQEEGSEVRTVTTGSSDDWYTRSESELCRKQDALHDMTSTQYHRSAPWGEP